MRALSRALLAIAAIAAMTACSESDRSDMSSDARDAAHSASTEATKVANDADMKRTEADLKHLGHVAAQDVRKGAAEAKAATNSMLTDAQHAAHKAGERQDQKDQTGSSSS
jgi:hypothetical protein